MPQPWLPADLLEAQLSTIDLLTAMFPSPGEIEFPDSTTPACITKLREWCETASNSPTPFPTGISSSILLAVHAPVADGTKTIQVNISIPLQSVDPSQQPPLSYSLRQPDWMTKAQVGQLAAEMPSDDIFEALEYLREEASRFLETEQTSTLTGNPTKTDSAPIVRVWFYFPSLSTREKRNDMVHNAPDYGLTGFVLAGKPGVLCLEGASREIDAYMSFIKTHSWGDIPSHQKKVSERYRETGEVRRMFGGMEEITDSLGERGGQRANRGDMQALEAWLRERGLHEAFDKVIF